MLWLNVSIVLNMSVCLNTQYEMDVNDGEWLLQHYGVQPQVSMYVSISDGIQHPVWTDSDYKK